MSDIFKDMSGLYSNFKVHPSRKSGTLILDERYGLNVDEKLPPADWDIFDAANGDYVLQADVPGHTQLIKSFVDDWDSLSGYPAKDPLDNLKESGFEISKVSEEIDEVELKTSEEEEQKIIEMERREKDAEAAKIAQEAENARKREENERLLEMAAQAKQQEDEELEKHKNETITVNSEKNEVYEEPDEQEEDIPPIKKGEVKLLGILYDLIEDDLLQIFGHTGTGKTSIAMKAATEARELKKSVIYIDTEHNITKMQADSIKKLGIVYEYIPKFDNLYSFIKRLPKYDVVIVDSLGLPVLSLFAEANMKEKGNALMKMIAISSFLKNYANENHSLVIVLNQPESDMNKDPNTERKPFGDKSSYCYKEIISSKFAKLGRTEKKTTIVVKAFRSRSCGMGTKLFTVEITGDGIKVIQ